jgi:hypothetical protein
MPHITGKSLSSKKASTPLKIYLKSPEILEKASISLKVFKNLYKNLTFLNKTLHFIENVFKKASDSLKKPRKL